MERWLKLSLLLCIFGFLKEFRPSEPFITPYLVGPWKNFTYEEVNQQIYPVGTYSYLAQLIVVFLVTDLLRYKPVIVLEGISGIITWTLLIVGQTIASMQAVEFFYGTFMATEVAYYTYIYAQVDREHYQQVTSHTRTAFLLGRFSSGLVGQILVSTQTMDYYQLNFITVTGVTLATVWAFFLPPANRSIYFHRKASISVVDSGSGDVAFEISKLPAIRSEPENSRTANRLSRKCGTAYKFLWRDFKEAFTNTYVLKWSIWWALATCGFLQGYTYVQVLWETIQTENQGTSEEMPVLYNGAVEALYTLVAAAAALGCGWLRFNWRVLGEATLAACALLEGAALMVSAYATSIWLAYFCYVVFGVLYHTMITIVNAEVAKHINEDSYGLIFGVNTFFALVLQTILTAVVAAEGGLALGAREQFIVYGSYFLVLGGVFALIAVVSLCRGKLHDQPLWLPKPPAVHQS